MVRIQLAQGSYGAVKAELDALGLVIWRNLLPFVAAFPILDQQIGRVENVSSALMSTIDYLELTKNVSTLLHLYLLLWECDF